LIGELETGGCRHRHGKCRPYGPEEISGEIVSQQNTGCLPTTPAPEGRHNLCRGREAPGLEEAPPPIHTGGSRHRHFDAGPPGLKTKLESMPGSGVFAVGSARRTSLICLSGQLPHDDSPAPTATHTLQESHRVCDSIAWLAGRGDFARGSVMKHRHDSIVAIGNTPEPKVE
jgi:hypothetical protein